MGIIGRKAEIDRYKELHCICDNYEPTTVLFNDNAERKGMCRNCADARMTLGHKFLYSGKFFIERAGAEEVIAGFDDERFGYWYLDTLTEQLAGNKLIGILAHMRKYDHVAFLNQTLDSRMETFTTIIEAFQNGKAQKYLRRFDEIKYDDQGNLKFRIE